MHATLLSERARLRALTALVEDARAAAEDLSLTVAASRRAAEAATRRAESVRRQVASDEAAARRAQHERAAILASANATRALLADADARAAASHARKIRLDRQYIRLEGLAEDEAIIGAVEAGKLGNA